MMSFLGSLASGLVCCTVSDLISDGTVHRYIIPRHLDSPFDFFRYGQTLKVTEVVEYRPNNKTPEPRVFTFPLKEFVVDPSNRSSAIRETLINQEPTKYDYWYKGLQYAGTTGIFTTAIHFSEKARHISGAGKIGYVLLAGFSVLLWEGIASGAVEGASVAISEKYKTEKPWSKKNSFVLNRWGKGFQDDLYVLVGEGRPFRSWRKDFIVEIVNDDKN